MASDDEENNSDEEFQSLEGKSGVIFLIDSRSSMFTKDIEDDENNEISRINLALKCCRAQFLNRIIAKQKDLVGVVLFGTAKSDPKCSLKHVCPLVEPNYPGAQAVKQLDRLLQDKDSEEIKSTFGSSDDFLLSEALWFCHILLTRRADTSVSLAEKRIVMFTDDCNPHANDVHRAHLARTKAKDLKSGQITLEIVPIGGPDFDYGKFYKELVEIVNGPQDSDVFDPDPSTKFEELLERVNRLDFKRRRYAKLKWNLGNNVHLGVSLYTLYREANVLPQQALSRATNEPVSRVKQTYDKTTGELILPTDIVEYLSMAGSDIPFTREEKNALNQIMEPGLTLLGFKPLSVVSEGQHCGQPSFVFPEETLIKGSRKLMKALVERCIAKQKVAVCCMTARYRALTKYYYLVPSEEVYEDNVQISPCGFHAIPIPFDTDTREQKFEYSSEVDPLALELVKKVVNKLKMSYKPSDFQNPKLQLFWGHLEALALEYPAPSGVEDSTVPDLEAQSARLGDLTKEFNDTFDLEGQPTPTGAKKREAKQYSGPSKRTRRDENSINIDEDIRAAIPKKKVETFTVAQLKEFLIQNDVKVNSYMKKADLVNAVYNMNV